MDLRVVGLELRGSLRHGSSVGNLAHVVIRHGYVCVCVGCTPGLCEYVAVLANVHVCVRVYVLEHSFHPNVHVCVYVYVRARMCVCVRVRACVREPRLVA